MKLKVDILPNYFLKYNGEFNLEEALLLSGRIAGVCYDREGYNHLVGEGVSKTNRRINTTINNGHHSVYDHVNISFNIQNIPKLLAMILNNEKQYTTSEKSLRYTPIDDRVISKEEVELYNKWIPIFKDKISSMYGDIYNENHINKLAMENARYLISVFVPTQMIYTTSLRQINYIAGWLREYINNNDSKDYFNKELCSSMNNFINELERLNVLDDRLMKNDKHRNISLFGNDLEKHEEYFGDVYSTNYKASLAMLAQAQRHRSIAYQMEFLDDEFYVPVIISDDDKLRDEWLHDIKSVKEVVPQGKMVYINESGNYDNFILKCKERLCSAAQLEIMRNTRETLLKYKDALERKNSYLKDDIEKYSHGARCSFPDYNCSNDCKFNEGKILIRKI